MPDMHTQRIRQVILDASPPGRYDAGMSTCPENVRAFLSDCGVPDGALHRLDVLERLYCDLLSANERLNLTRITDLGEFWTLHVADSLLAGRIAPDLLSAAPAVADVGCGGGFPLFALAWANPKLDLLGVESRFHKSEFVAEEAASLGFSNVQVVHLQAREAGLEEQYAHSRDVVLLRAVGSAGKMVREVRGLLKREPGARILFYKTPETVEAELPLAEREARKFGFSLEVSDEMELPGGTRRQFLTLRRM